MCGIVGFLDVRKRLDAGAAEQLVRAMAGAIAHRGPDGDGTYVEAEAGLALGHRRLSIIDLSDAGSQPMHSANGRWVISYNGEIYNFEEMRRTLEERGETIAWRGHSDTEVLIEFIARLGFEAALRNTNGMFAIAAWDRQERALYLARDRLGEKPVYYGWQGRTFLFGSELKAIAAHPDFARQIDPVALSHFVSYSYVPSPFSIWRGLKQLRPGCYIRLSASAAPETPIDQLAYWRLPAPVPRPIAETEAVDELDRLLGESTRLRMRADVPMGAFLSGGIDSSTIVGLMQANAQTPTRSYTIGFDEDSHDESHFAREVAQHLGTAHTDMHVSPQDALDVIPMLPTIYDEPFADASQIPTFLLSKLTRGHVTVALSGDGGDELFGGYSRYFKFERRWGERLRGIALLRPALASMLTSIPPNLWLLLYRIAPGRLHDMLYPNRIKRAAASIATRTEQEFYRYLVQRWPEATLARPHTEIGGIFFEQNDIASFADPFLGMTYLDTGSYLPDDILVKVDRAAMAVSLETRVPMLDHRVVEFAASLPVEMKRRGTTGKWILRRVLDRYVPRALIDRPKRGFSMPVAEWLRGPLKDWSSDLLNDRQSIIGGLIDLPLVRDVWQEHLRGGEVDHTNRIWTILMLIAWARQWRPG